MNAPTGADGMPSSLRRRATPSKSRIVGAADGSIIATIMTVHMPINQASVGVLPTPVPATLGIPGIATARAADARDIAIRTT